MSLVDLYNKNNHTTDKNNGHTYLEIYDKIFYRLKEKKNRILEIGVYQGDSLNLWAEYFTNSIIYGVDVRLSQISVKLHKNVRIAERNAYCRKTMYELMGSGEFDIIIDDGTHIVNNQKFVVKNYSRMLTDNGILVVEDITIGNRNNCCVPNIDELIDCFPERLRRHVYYIDRRSINNREDDFLLICDKNIN